jgi:hypothetical protein
LPDFQNAKAVGPGKLYFQHEILNSENILAQNSKIAKNFAIFSAEGKNFIKF